MGESTDREQKTPFTRENTRPYHRAQRSRSRKAQTGESKTVEEISLRRNLPHSSFSLFWLLSVHSVVSVVKFFRLLRGFVLPGLVPGTPYLTAWANSGGRKKCQEPKNDFLASMCPKWVPDTLSALLPLPSRLLAPTTGLRHDQRMSPFPSPHHSKNRPILTWKSPSRSGMVNSSSAPSKRVVPSAR